MEYNRIYTFAFFVVAMMFVSTSSFAQRDYSQNVAAKATEVFKNCSEYAGTEYLPTYKEWLSRVEVKTQVISSNETYLKLNSIPLRNKCNMDLTFQNTNFDQSTFNPLKYLLDFETKEKLTYRIDGTNKILIVHPKQ